MHCLFEEVRPIKRCVILCVRQDLYHNLNAMPIPAIPSQLLHLLSLTRQCFNHENNHVLQNARLVKRITLEILDRVDFVVPNVRELLEVLLIEENDWQNAEYNVMNEAISYRMVQISHMMANNQQVHRKGDEFRKM